MAPNINPLGEEKTKKKIAKQNGKRKEKGEAVAKVSDEGQVQSDRRLVQDQESSEIKQHAKGTTQQTVSSRYEVDTIGSQ